MGGFIAYMVLYVISNIIPSTKAWWVANTGNFEPFLIAWVLGFLLLYFVSRATQERDKIPLGYFQVFFCDDYDERYTRISSEH